MSLFNPSATSNNMRGHQGPRPNSVLGLKNLEVDPLINIEKEEGLKELFIHWIKESLNPVWIRISLRKSLLILSHALNRSILINMEGNLLVLIICILFCAIPTASWICLSFKNPNCSGNRTFDRTTSSFLAIALEIILYIELHNEMGRKLSNGAGLSLLGVRAKKVALIPF